MPFMVSANRFINLGVIPLLLVAYAVFLCIDHYRNVLIADIKHHIEGIQNVGSVDAVVFGASNGYYSLSADTLSNYTGTKWHNASMDSELVSGTTVIEDLSSQRGRMRVK